MFAASPEPLHPAETPMAALRTAELFVVASARLWVAGLRDPEGNHPDWQPGFRAAAIEAYGAAGFDGLFTIVAGNAARGLDIRCPRCPRLGGDEAHLLHLLGLLQQQRNDGAAAMLADWLPPAAARAALPAAEAFAHGLAGSGLWIATAPRSAASLQTRIAAAYANRGLVLVQ